MLFYTQLKEHRRLGKPDETILFLGNVLRIFLRSSDDAKKFKRFRMVCFVDNYLSYMNVRSS